jgi:hypothetical protein
VLLLEFDQRVLGLLADRQILRSKASWSASLGLRPTIAILITGMRSMTAVPRPVVSVGTSRQPTSFCFSTLMKCSSRLTAKARAFSFCGRKHMATA